MLLGGCRVLLICLKGFSFSVWNVVGSCICHLISCGFTDTKKQFSDQASCSFTRAVSWCQKTETEWMIPCGKKVSGPSQAVRLTMLPPTHFLDTSIQSELWKPKKPELNWEEQQPSFLRDCLCLIKCSALSPYAHCILDPCDQCYGSPLWASIWRQIFSGRPVLWRPCHKQAY